MELRLLGGFRASVQGEPVAGLRASAPTRLLAYLALHRDTRPRRMFVAGLFWPDGSDLRARRRLSHTLWVLQTALAPVAPSLVQADRETLGLDPDANLWIDALEFEHEVDLFETERRAGRGHLHAHALERAVELYRGDLMADHYDDWLEPARHRLREKFLVGLRQLVQLQKSRGEYRLALVTARRLVGETPLAEHAHAELMRLYWLAGRPNEAIAQYESCRGTLAEELGVEPSEELVALRERILSHRTPPALTASDADRTPAEADALVGRSEDRARLLEVVDAAVGGAGGFALLEGRPGMGKTRLLADVAEAARWRGACVLWASHPESRGIDPYGGIAEALAEELQGLQREQVVARLDPELLALAARVVPTLAEHATVPQPREWNSPDERFRLQEGLIQVLLALGEVMPTTLIIDDLHWADPSTLELIRLAAPRLVKSQVAVIVGYGSQQARNHPEVWSLLTDVEHRYPVTRVSLRGFDRDQVATLVAARLRRPVSNTLVERLEQATGGNPLFVIETLRALEQRLAADDTLADPDLGALVGAFTEGPEQVTDVLLRDIESAPPPVQAVVSVLAVWGRATTSAVVARLAGLERTAALDALRKGVEAEFVAETDGRYMLRFEQLTAAARARLPDRERRLYHERAGEVLAERPTAQASELARHYRMAEDWAAAARYEAAAGARAAGLHAYESAAEYYRLALESLDNAELAPTPGTLFGYESVLDVLGRRSEQGRVLEMFDPRELTVNQQLRVLRRRALHLANTDQLLEAIRVAGCALGFSVAARLDWTPHAVTMATVLLNSGRPHLARQHLRGLEHRDGATSDLAGAHLALGQALIDLQDFEGAHENLDAALGIYEQRDDRRGRVETLAAMAALDSQVGNSIVAQRRYHEAIALARQIGARFGEGVALANLALLCYLQGDVATALGHMHEAIDVFVAIADRRCEAMVRANSASILHAALGDDERAEREASLARRYFVEIGDRRHEAQCLGVLAGIRRRKRAHAVARRLLTSALEAVRAEGDRWLEVQMLHLLAWNERDAGRTQEAHDALSRAVSLCRELDMDAELAALLALQASILAAGGHHDEARAVAHEAVECSDTVSELRHIAAWWCSQAFEAAGDHAEAERQLQRAHELLSELVGHLDDDDRRRALTRVAEHREVTDAYASRFPRSETVSLPPAQSGGSRERVEVRWTLHHPDDLLETDRRDRRKRRLIRLLSEAHEAGASPRLEDLADALDASVSTVKRDLAALRAAGILD